MSDTPETDHIENNLGNAVHPILSSFCRRLERERDDAIEMMERTRYNSGQIIASQAAENIQLTEQRDKLAEALKRIRNGYGGQMTDPDCGCEDCEFLIEIDTALQFLNPKEP